MTKKPNKTIVFLSVLCLSPISLLIFLYEKFFINFNITWTFKNNYNLYKHKANKLFIPILNILAVFISLIKNIFRSSFSSIISILTMLIVILSIQLGFKIIFILSLTISLLIILLGISIPSSKVNNSTSIRFPNNIKDNPKRKKPQIFSANSITMYGSLLFISTLISKIFIPYILILLIITFLICFIYYYIKCRKQIKNQSNNEEK